MLNPFIIAGLVLSAVGLLQEASDSAEEKPKAIAGPPGKDGKPGAPGKDGKNAPAKPKAKSVETPSDG